MTTIYLIRHGQASFGQQNYDQLSNKGERQAQILGQALKQVINQPTYAIAGSLQRHQQTANIALSECFPNIALKTNAGWNEFNHQQVIAKYDPRFEQAEAIKQELALAANPKAYMAEIFHAAVSRWTSGEYDHDYDEPWPMFKQRIDQALQQLCKDLIEQKTKQALVFTSGGVISTVLGQLLELSLHKTFELNWAINNASITALGLSNGHLKLLSLNEHYFLKAENADLVTWV